MSERGRCRVSSRRCEVGDFLAIRLRVKSDPNDSKPRLDA